MPERVTLHVSCDKEGCDASTSIDGTTLYECRDLLRTVAWVAYGRCSPKISYFCKNHHPARMYYPQCTCSVHVWRCVHLPECPKGKATGNRYATDAENDKE